MTTENILENFKLARSKEAPHNEQLLPADDPAQPENLSVLKYPGKEKDKTPNIPRVNMHEFSGLENPPWGAHPDSAIPSKKTFELLPPTPQQYDYVVKCFNQFPSKKFTINTIQFIAAAQPAHSFNQHISTLSQQKEYSPDFDTIGNNDTEAEKNWRKEIYNQSQELAKPFTNPNYPYVNFGPYWHGTKEAYVNAILEEGFRFTGETDPGYFGQAVYLTPHGEYAADTYAQGVMIFAMTAYKAARPVIKKDMDDLFGKPLIAEEFDVNYVPVVPLSPDDPEDQRYIPTEPGERYTYKYIELAFLSANGYYPVLPSFLLTLQPLLPATPSVSLFIQAIRLYDTGVLAKKYGDPSEALAAFKIAAEANFMPAVSELNDEDLRQKAETDPEEKKQDYSSDVAYRLANIYQKEKNEQQFFYEHLLEERKSPLLILEPENLSPTSTVVELNDKDLSQKVETDNKEKKQAYSGDVSHEAENIPQQQKKNQKLLDGKKSSSLSFLSFSFFSSPKHIQEKILTLELINACINREKDKIFNLIKNGASLIEKDVNGYNALGYLIFRPDDIKPNIKLIKAAIKIYQEVHNISQFPIDITQGGQGTGGTPLSFACQKNWITHAEFYLECGADPRIIRETDFLTCLDICAAKNYVELFQLILNGTYTFTIIAADLKRPYQIATEEKYRDITTGIEDYSKTHKINLSTEETYFISPIGTSPKISDRVHCWIMGGDSFDISSIQNKLNSITPGYQWTIHPNGLTGWTKFNSDKKFIVENIAEHLRKNGLLCKIDENISSLIVYNLSYEKIKNISECPISSISSIKNFTFSRSEFE